MAISFHSERKTAVRAPTRLSPASSLQMATMFCGHTVVMEGRRDRSWKAWWWLVARALALVSLGVLLVCGTFRGPGAVVLAMVPCCTLFACALGAWQLSEFLSEPVSLDVGVNGEAIAARALGFGEETTVGGVKVTDIGTPSGKELSLAARKWIQRVKLHFGHINDTAADRICVARWLAEEMKKADMRDCDARRLVPIVSRMASIPDADDIFAGALMRSTAVAMARALGGEPQK